MPIPQAVATQVRSGIIKEQRLPIEPSPEPLAGPRFQELRLPIKNLRREAAMCKAVKEAQALER